MVRKNQSKVQSRELKVSLWALLLLTLSSQLLTSLLAQQTPGPTFRVNSKAVQGVGPGDYSYGQTVDLYVSPTGSDTTGNGTLGNPYQTIARALKDIPVFVSHHYIIHLAAGTYREEVLLENRYFGAAARSTFQHGSIEIQGDPASPDSYVISGADAGAPTVAVRDYVVSASFAHFILNGVSLQYGKKFGLFQTGGVGVLHSCTVRNFTAETSSTAVGVRLFGVLELRGDNTISDAVYGLVIQHFASVFSLNPVEGLNPRDYLNTGWPDSQTFTLTGITGSGIDLYDNASYEVSNTTSISATGGLATPGIEVEDYSTYDSENTTISGFTTGILADVFGRVEINQGTISNATTGMKVHFQSGVDFLSAEPVFSNVTTSYDIQRLSFVTTPTQRLFDGALESIGAISLAAGGANQNITLTPSGTGFTIVNGRTAVGGETSPAYKLHVRSETNPYLGALGLDGTVNPSSKYGEADVFLNIRNPNASPARKELFSLSGEGFYSDGGILTDYDFFIWDYVANTMRLFIGSNGKVEIKKAIFSAVNSVAFSATPTFDADLGNTQKITLAGNVTSSTLSNASAGEQIHFIVCQDAPGSRAFVWPSNVKGGMTVGGTSSTCSAQSFIFDGTNAYAVSPGVTNM